MLGPPRCHRKTTGPPTSVIAAYPIPSTIKAKPGPDVDVAAHAVTLLGLHKEQGGKVLVASLKHPDAMVNQMAEYALWSIWFRSGSAEANHELCQGTRAMNRWERARIVGEYVRARLRLECEQRGRAAKIAEKTGFAAAHISLVRKGGRTVGTELARAMAELWGMDYEALEKLAFETHGIPYSAPAPVVRDLPNLRATIDWCREGKVYPSRFLRRYETQAELAGVDRTRREWLVNLEAAYAEQAGEYRTKRKRNEVQPKSRPRVRSREERSGVHPKEGIGRRAKAPS